jgi:Uma2 family endonuclease
MQAALKHDFVTVEDYLSGEETSRVKHEYIGGAVFAMAGSTSDHNQIGLNLAFAARPRLKGKPCKLFIFDFKLRIQIAQEDVLYYPDIMVGCDPRDTHTLYLRFPKLLVEISSDSTERLDRGEKLLAYQTIETLEEYLIVSQDRPHVTIFRRSNNWTAEVLTALNEAVILRSVDLSLPLSSIYDGVAV